METEKGDDYIRRLAAFIHTNEKGLAEAGVSRRRRAQRPQASDATSYLNPLSWLGLDAAAGNAPKPIILSTDTHHLFYVLMRLEALDYDVGTLDVQIDHPSRPMSYVNLFTESDKSETLSLASFRSSLSAVSRLSLGGGWWSRAEPPSIDIDLKYIYSSFTKLPALTIQSPSKSTIAELVVDPPGQNALPLEAFKNLQTLQCIDIDPRTLLGWDRLAESLRSLTIKKSGLEDISDIFVGAVIDDQARREGSASRKRKRRIPKRYGKQQSTLLPDTVVEDEAGESSEDVLNPHSFSPSPPPAQLSSLKWAFLKHLCLADNALTFIPPEPLSHLTSVTHLDLSSNLLVSVPPALSTLYNIVSLNLSDNMIDSVLGIYLNLGRILSLNLSHNRLESLCGLERLHALERVDLRSNLIEESSEVGRLATLPNISDVWIEGNPFVEYEEGYRVACFNHFWKEGKTITLDGSPPGFYERQSLSSPPPEQLPAARSQIAAHSPAVVAIGQTHQHRTPDPPSSPAIDGLPTPPSSDASPHLGPSSAGKPKRRHQKRVVEFDSGDSAFLQHSKLPSDESGVEKRGRFAKPGKKGGNASEKTKSEDTSLTPTATRSEVTTSLATFASTALKQVGSVPAPTTDLQAPRRSRHSRYQTEYQPSGSSKDFDVGVLNDAPPTPFSFRQNSRSATISSKSGLRRARVSASVYEASSHAVDGGSQINDGAEEYRRRIEALKKDMGDGWLKVLSQSEIKSPS